MGLQTVKDAIPEKTDNRTEDQDLQKIDEIDIQICRREEKNALRSKGYDVFSLAIIDEMNESGIRFR